MALPPNRASGPFRPLRVGSWEVIAKIAGGGMSAIYLGRSTSPSPDVPPVVALKVMRHEMRDDDRLSEMFLAEGRLIARLIHPNIVRTHEVGGDAEQDFIAMELMLGKTFAAIHDTAETRGLRLNAEIAAWVVARVADALHYAHELRDDSGRPLSLVHRDVNPANIFATFGGDVKLFDFGLAKVTADEPTGSRMLAGKLSYLSPEQIMAMQLDRRSDIFSLGTTFWELLTGKRLFRRPSDIETVRAVQFGPIPDPRTVAPEVPEELALVARRALERNREHRYPTAYQFARDLDAFVLTHRSPDDITARLAALVDTLFPGEQKRQSGWLKPSLASSSRESIVPGPPRASIPPIPRESIVPGPPRASIPPIPRESIVPGPPRASIPPVAAPRSIRPGTQGTTSIPPTWRDVSPSIPPTTLRSGPPSPPSAWPPPASEAARSRGMISIPTPPMGTKTDVDVMVSIPTTRSPIESIPPAPTTERDVATATEGSSSRLQRAEPSQARTIPTARSPFAPEGRQKRAPIPLPSRLRTDAPPRVEPSKKSSAPAPNDRNPTALDIPGSPKRR